MSAASLGDKVIAWASAEAAVHLLVLIGSRTRSPGTLGAADGTSDWDFQIATAQPERFATGEWLNALGLKPTAYSLRAGRLGSAPKASAVTDFGAVDVVILPADSLRGVAQLVLGGRPIDDPRVRQALTDLSAVIAGGYRVLKGAEEFAPFYAFVAREISPARLDDAQVVRGAEAFVCDYVFTRRKIARGEFVAAQRWLHHQLAEANLRLLHELRLRRGQVSFPDGRRLELIGEPEIDGVRVAARPNGPELQAALEQCAEAHRRLVAALVGPAWFWPDLSRLRLGAE